MARCPACGINLSDWHILTLGGERTVRCTKCGKALMADPKMTKEKAIVAAGFFLGGVSGGLCAVAGHMSIWGIFISIWSLFFIFVHLRFSILKAQEAAPPKKD